MVNSKQSGLRTPWGTSFIRDGPAEATRIPACMTSSYHSTCISNAWFFIFFSAISAFAIDLTPLDATDEKNVTCSQWFYTCHGLTFMTQDDTFKCKQSSLIRNPRRMFPRSSDSLPCVTSSQSWGSVGRTSSEHSRHCFPPNIAMYCVVVRRHWYH